MNIHWHNIQAVIMRELRIFRQRPIYLMGSVVAITFCCVFFLTFFKNGITTDLPVGVIDNDNSSVSREFIRQVDATQLSRVVRYSDYTQARKDMQSGKITCFCVIPENMSADILANRRPVFTFYYNALYFISGSMSFQNITRMINLTNGAVQREYLRAKGVPESQVMGMLQPIDVDMHAIGNQYINYGYYLVNILLPGILQMLIIIIIIYSLGSELKYGTSRHLLMTSGNSILTALIGKLIVFTVLFTAIGLILILLMYDWMHFPIAGSIWNMLFAIILLVLASESVGILIIGLLPVPRLALSIGALYSILGLTLSGFTLPVESMPAIIQGLASAYPIRHYYLFYCQEVIFGTGFIGWWQEVIHLLLFLFLPLFIMQRLKGAYIKQNFPTN